MKSKISFVACFCCIFASYFLTADDLFFTDPEVNPSTFILGTKQINVPGYPNACNGSIVKWNDQILMSFRDIYDPIFLENGDNSGLGESNIGLIWLDTDFNPIGDPQFLDFQALSSLSSMPEDPRLILVNNSLFMVYSDNRQLENFWNGTRMYVAEIGYEYGQFWVKYEVCLDDFENNLRFNREKNWVPFTYDNILLLAYSLVPHRILEPNLLTGVCKTIDLTRGYINWNWGTLRGGTPGLKIEENQYLAFFHSVLDMPSIYSQGLTMPHYFIGAYTFNSEPPFQITQISHSPIIGQGFYSGQEYDPFWNPVKVVFPCGYIFDENYIWLSYGRQDHEIFIVMLDRVGLLNSLIKVKTRHL